MLALSKNTLTLLGKYLFGKSTNAEYTEELRINSHAPSCSGIGLLV